MSSVICKSRLIVSTSQCGVTRSVKLFLSKPLNKTFAGYTCSFSWPFAELNNIFVLVWLLRTVPPQNHCVFNCSQGMMEIMTCWPFPTSLFYNNTLGKVKNTSSSVLWDLISLDVLKNSIRCVEPNTGSVFSSLLFFIFHLNLSHASVRWHFSPSSVFRRLPSRDVMAVAGIKEGWGTNKRSPQYPYITQEMSHMCGQLFWRVY